jgi:hypothetical protein
LPGLSAALTMLIWTMTCVRCVIFTGEFAAPVHGVEFFLRRTPVCQLRCQQVGGRDRVLHREIDANAVLPGWIDTDLTRRARKEIDGLHDRVLARTPAARWGAIDDFAGSRSSSLACVRLRHQVSDSHRWQVFAYGIGASSLGCA